MLRIKLSGRPSSRSGAPAPHRSRPRPPRRSPPYAASKWPPSLVAAEAAAAGPSRGQLRARLWHHLRQPDSQQRAAPTSAAPGFMHLLAAARLSCCGRASRPPRRASRGLKVGAARQPLAASSRNFYLSGSRGCAPLLMMGPLPGRAFQVPRTIGTACSHWAASMRCLVFCDATMRRMHAVATLPSDHPSIVFRYSI